MHIDRNSQPYKLVLWIFLFAGVAMLWWLNMKVLSNPVYIKVDDFSHYWGAGRLILTKDNPYDPQRIQALKNQITAQSSGSEKVAIVYTPPWSLPILMPFGLLEYRFSRILWLLTSVTILLVCSRTIWTIYTGPVKYAWLAWVLGFSFAPTISVFEKGQITPIVLIGIVGFLYFTEKHPNEWLAGIFIALISVKPQVFYLFWIALSFWILVNRKWRLALAAGLSVTAGTIIPMLFNSNLLPQYLQAFLLEKPTDWASPTFGGYLRIIFGIDQVWMQFLPVLIGSLWMVVYYLRHKDSWIWSEQAPLLILVSFVLGGYAWTYDQVLSLVAVIPAFIAIIQEPRNLKNRLAIGIYILINLLDLFLHRALDEFWFVWLAPAVLIWYVSVMSWSKRQASRERGINIGSIETT